MANTLDDFQRVACVDETIASRRSIREFLPKPVSCEQVTEILSVSSRSPSGHNTQPWSVQLVMGQSRDRLVARVTSELEKPGALDLHRPAFDSYPSEWVSPFIDRRRQTGKGLYNTLGIPKGDKARMEAQTARNYTFFGAPVGLIFSLHRLMIPGGLADLGMFMQTIMLAARARGLDTCAQVAWSIFHDVLAEELRLPPDQVVICGMALGYADDAAPVNRFQPEREPTSVFTTLHT